MKDSINNETSSISKEVLCRVSRNISISCEACLAGGRQLDSCEIRHTSYAITLRWQVPCSGQRLVRRSAAQHYICVSSKFEYCNRLQITSSVLHF